jgi:hypothetical protein
MRPIVSARLNTPSARPMRRPAHAHARENIIGALPVDSVYNRTRSLAASRCLHLAERSMIGLWLRTALVAGLALAAWISGIDTTGNGTESLFLWAATALACAHFAMRFFAGAR